MNEEEKKCNQNIPVVKRIWRILRFFCPLTKIVGVDIAPGDGGGPGGPEGGGGTGGAGGEAGPPLAGLQDAGGDVGLAVAVKVADLDVDPGDGGVPNGPEI